MLSTLLRQCLLLYWLMSSAAGKESSQSPARRPLYPQPSLIYGTAWKKSETEKLALLALERGFRAIDTANQLKHYDEALVGAALVKSGIPREDLFIQTKFTHASGHDPASISYNQSRALADQVRESFEGSLLHLQTSYVDSYLLHAPNDGVLMDGSDWAAWRAMEAIYTEPGERIRQLGVANFNTAQLRELLRAARVPPAVVQNRCYAKTSWDAEMRALCKEHNISYQAFCVVPCQWHLLEDATMKQISERHNVTVAQSIYRFLQQMGAVSLTGTRQQHRMDSAVQATTTGPLSFALSNEELQSIASIVDAAAPDGDSEVTVTFVNHLPSKSDTVSLMWVNHAGEEQRQAGVEGGQRTTLNTYHGHRWKVRLGDSVLLEWVADAASRTGGSSQVVEIGSRTSEPDPESADLQQEL